MILIYRIPVRLARFRPRLSRTTTGFSTCSSSRFNYTTSLFASETSESATMGRDKDKEKLSFNLKTPKGTKDWQGTDMILRDRIFSTITTVFKRHGAVTIDTPVFELREILAGKY
ncbi:MAG: hypothetical protein Q9169_005086, partial [Polycauliona sp. 2 TL-2023]